MRPFLALLVYLTACGGGKPEPDRVKAAQSAEDRAFATVIGLVNSEGVVGCAGVLVSLQLAITATQCVTAAQATRVGYFEDFNRAANRFRETSRFQTLYMNAITDVTVLLLKGNTHYAPLARKAAASGDDAFAIGHPSGSAYRMEPGKVAVAETPTGEVAFLVSTVPLPGLTGGPLLNYDGEVIGLNTVTTTVQGHVVSWHVHPKELQTALTAAKQ